MSPRPADLWYYVCTHRRRSLKYAALVVIIAVGVWLMLPPPGDVAAGSGSGGEGAAATGPDSSNRPITIQFAVGFTYMPGTVPFDMGKPLTGAADVIRDFEARFPDTHVEIITVPGVREYLVTQLSSGRAPDIINVNVEDVWVDVQKGWYLPLDPWLEAPNEFIREKGDPNAPGYNQWWDMFRYQAISRGKAAPDGLLYCLSFDMIETGIFYNKDAFAKVGAKVPTNWEELIDDCQKLKAGGYIPLLMNIDSINDWTVDLVFDQLYAGILPGIDLFKDPKREPYLDGYLDWDEIAFLYRKGYFTRKDPRYLEVWRIIKDARQYFNQNLATTDPVREFVTQQGAMFWNMSTLVYRLMADRQLGFDWGVFYLPQFTKSTSRFASGLPMCVIGGSATQLEVTNSAWNDTGDQATSTKLQRVRQLLQFLTVPENYVRIVNEYAALVPNIVGVPVRPELKPFEEFLERRYTTTKWIFTFDLKFGEVQRRMLELYLNGGTDLDGFMEWQEQNLEAAVNNLLVRKPVNWDGLQRTWDELAPVRATYQELPPND